MRRMGVTKQPSVLIPSEHRTEIFKLSKAALADMVWSLCAANTECADDPALAIEAFRKEREAILIHRSQI